MNAHTTLRIARPTDRLQEIVRFYVEGLGLVRLAAFEDHEGFDGIMVGPANGDYHLEFTHRRGHAAGGEPSAEHLLVFYLPSETEWRTAVDRMISAGYPPVPSVNPYWETTGQTFEDPDGYRVVLQRASWPA